MNFDYFGGKKIVKKNKLKMNKIVLKRNLSFLNYLSMFKKSIGNLIRKLK